MANTARNQPVGWYWVQDMRSAARPCWFDGSLYRDSPTSKSADTLSWHWPTMRVLAPCSEPDEPAIRAFAERTKVLPSP